MATPNLEPVNRFVVVPDGDRTLAIPVTELVFSYSRSGGPGGQHVNKTETRVELQFDVANSPSLDDRQRGLLLARLGNRIDKSGILHVVAGSTRSQADNRADAIERFKQLLQRALYETRPRVATRPTGGAKRRRVQRKRQRGVFKRLRGRVDQDEE